MPQRPPPVDNDYVKEGCEKFTAQAMEMTSKSLPDDPDEWKLNEWFTYHPPTEAQAEKYRNLRRTAKLLAETILSSCPPSADRTAALRKVREAVMTANASIACGGV